MANAARSRAEYHREYRSRNLEADRAKHARYRERHPDRVKAKLKKWRDSEKGRAWAEQYREQQRWNWSRCYYGNLEHSRFLKRLNESRRRSIKANAAGDATEQAVLARIAYYGGRCYRCGSEWHHIDHVIPLSKGGTNWPANLRPACRTCNLTKGAKR